MRINMNVVGYVLKNLTKDLTYKKIALDSRECGAHWSIMTCKRLGNLNPQYRYTERPSSVSLEKFLYLFRKYKKEYFHDMDAEILRKIRELLEYIGADTSRLEEYFYCDLDSFFTRFYNEAVNYYTAPDHCLTEQAPSENEPDDTAIQFQTVSQLQERGLTLQTIVGQILQNDQILFGNIGQHSGFIDQWVSHLQRHPDNWGFLLCKKRIVGNFSMTLLSSDDEQLFRQGKLAGNDLTAGRAASPVNETLSVDLMNLSILPDYATEDNYRILWTHFGERLQELIKSGATFRTIYTCLFNEQQVGFFTKKGFRHLSAREGRGEIYSLDLTYSIPQAFEGVLDGVYDEYITQYGDDAIRFGPCPSVEDTDALTLSQAQQIGDLIYSTDPYIYQAIFNGREEAKVLLAELLMVGTDPVFATKNVYCAFCADRVIGLIHFFVGRVEWSPQALMEQAFFCGFSLKDTYKHVENEYFPSYNRENTDTMTLLHVCVDPLWQSSTARLGSRMMKAFLSEYGHRYDMELHVLAETRAALRLYQRSGFKSDGKEHRGFSVTDEKPPCFHMKREKTIP